MKEKLMKLKTQREHLNKLDEEYKAKLDQFNEDNKALIEERTEAGGIIAVLSDEIREVALIEFEKTGEKKLEGGVGIRVTQKLEYDADKALEWAENSGMALQLDKRSFESFAKAQIKDLKKAKLGFVGIKQVVSATIPTEIKVGESDAT